MDTPWLEPLFLAVKRYIRRHGHRMVQATGSLSQLYVGIEEARGLLGGGPAETLGLPPEEALAGALEAARGADPGPAVTSLAERMDLTPRQLRLLLAAAGPLVSVDLARLYTFAWADFALKVPSVGFLCELLDDPTLREELAPDAPLVRYQLVELRDAPVWGAPTPLLHRGVVVPDAVVAGLLGSSGATLPADVALVARVERAADAPSLDDLLLGGHARADLKAALGGALEGGRPRLLLLGAGGVGRRSAVRAVAALHGRDVVVAQLDPEHLAAIAREARLRRAVLLLRGDALFEDAERWAAEAPRVARLVERHAGPVVFTARAPVAALHHVVSDLFEIPFALPSAADQRALWGRALGAERRALADDLGQRFTVTPGTIRAAVDEARAHQALAGGAGPLGVEDVARAVRRRLDHALSRVAEPFVTTLTWDDVVLPADVMETLQEILAQARFREQVYDTWGFRRTVSYGRGLACLFCGPPGTGKTMMAGLIANSLGREIYRVDLSRIVSKWVGETEKNLGRVFDEAEQAQVILLFDEADSLFSSRTEVRGSNDRFANMEINYLLQRMEQYDGMSLLTTNFEQSIDDAFKRRLKFKVDFPLPDAEDRARLWERMLPPEAEVAGDVRFSVLGKKFKLAGGHIKNAVVRAAFYAARAGAPIDHALLEKAAVAESRDLGRLV